MALRTKILSSVAAGLATIGILGGATYAHVRDQKTCFTFPVQGWSPVVPPGDHIDTRIGPNTWRRCVLRGD